MFVTTVTNQYGRRDENLMAFANGKENQLSRRPSPATVAASIGAELSAPLTIVVTSPASHFVRQRWRYQTREDGRSQRLPASSVEGTISLYGLLVLAVGRYASDAGHAAKPFLRKNTANVGPFVPHVRRPNGTPRMRRKKDLRQVGEGALGEGTVRNG